MLAYALLLLVGVRLLSLGLREGTHPDAQPDRLAGLDGHAADGPPAETLFPLYAGLITPVWLRLLGMRIGRGAEVSTVLALPSLTTVGEGAFLADDTLVATVRARRRLAADRAAPRSAGGPSSATPG